MTKFNATSIRRMSGVDPRLVAVMKAARAASPIPFEITEGLRDRERQRYLVRTGKSRTMNSYHLRGKAVDVVAMPGGKVSWSLPDYRAINTAVQKAAKTAGVTITWGGSWKSIVDGVHFQIEG
jgi:peptidoglycan L-alanyl-D-glutamate endopeptidase CwlK